MTKSRLTPRRLRRAGAENRGRESEGERDRHDLHLAVEVDDGEPEQDDEGRDEPHRSPIGRQAGGLDPSVDD
jgi:hypothetical protein